MQETRDAGSIPGSGRSPGEGNGNPRQYSCLENPMGGGAWQATVCGVAKESDRTDPLTMTMAEFQKEKNVILKCSIYVPVNTDVCIEQHAITGRAKEIKYIIFNPSLKTS